MKLILFIGIMLTALTPVSGQKFEVGLSGGIVRTNRWIADYKPEEGYAFSIRIMNDAGPHMQNGISIDVQSITATTDRDTGGANHTEEVRAKFGAPLLAIRLFSNYRYTIGHAYIYAGGAIGFIACGSPDENNTPYEGGKGFLLGAQFGGAYYITKRIGISAEAAPSYDFVGWDKRVTASNGSGENRNEGKGMFVIALTAGIRVRI